MLILFSLNVLVYERYYIYFFLDLRWQLSIQSSTGNIVRKHITTTTNIKLWQLPQVDLLFW